MTKHRIGLVGWAALAPGAESREQWQQWLSGSITLGPAFEKQPSPTQVPAMLRRRLGPLGKLALACAYGLEDKFVAKQASVFASQHGEVHRTVAMLNDLAGQQPLSPTAFSLSVHNSIAGIHSIAQKDVQAITAISAGPDTACSAILEAAGILAEGRVEQVLCVIYDQALPDMYMAQDRAPEFPLSMALLLAPADNCEDVLTFELSANPEPSVSTPEPSLSLLRFLLDDEQRHHCLRAGLRQWDWGKE